MKQIICIIGKTSSGKDVAANYLREKYGIKAICSYTTRDMRDYEENGVQHYFISKDYMKYLVKNCSVLAYTRNEETGIEYCATLESMTQDTMVYIINPEGVQWLKEHVSDVILHTIYIYSSEELILQRAIKRGDNPNVLQRRLESERTEFDEYRQRKDYDVLVSNEGCIEYLKSQLDLFMSRFI